MRCAVHLALLVSVTPALELLLRAKLLLVQAIVAHRHGPVATTGLSGRPTIAIMARCGGRDVARDGRRQICLHHDETDDRAEDSGVPRTNE